MAGAENRAPSKGLLLGLSSPPSSGSERSGGEIAKAKKPAGRKAKKPAKGEPSPSEGAADPAAEPSGAAAPAEAGATQPLGLSGSNRVEFDAQLIKGQVTKAGEVQVLERRETEIKSLVKRRTSFREEIIKTVFPEKQQ